MITNNVPGRTIRASFNHTDGVGTVVISFSDLRRSALHNVLGALDDCLADFAKGAPAGTVFASTRTEGGPRQYSWRYTVTAEPTGSTS